jgi:hypothetical protein
MLTRKNGGNTPKNVDEKMLPTLLKNVDEKMLLTLRNVDEKKYWQSSEKMLRKNIGITSKKC